MVVWEIASTAFKRFFQANGLFLASGLAFDLLLYCIPLLLLTISILGYTLAGSAEAVARVQEVVHHALPASEKAFADNLAAVIANRGLLGLAAFVLFFLFGSTIFGSARIALNTLFGDTVPRSFFRGKLQDFLVMLLAGSVLLVMVGTFSLLALLRGSVEQWPLFGRLIGPGWTIVVAFIGALFSLALFLLMYRYSPSQSLRWKALVIGAAVGAGLFELSKIAFVWYVEFVKVNVAFYGALGSVIFFCFWLYYACMVFLFGAAVSRAYDERRSRRASDGVPAL